MVIVKRRSAATTGNTDNWVVKHISLAGTQQLYLNQTIATFNAGATAHGGISISTSTFGFLSGTTGVDQVNENTKDYVAYCFAEVEGFSKFSSYTGNGIADGPFVYTGFRPAFVMIKNADDGFNGGSLAASHSWVMLDSKRSTYNRVDNWLGANYSSSELTSARVDFLSNGFKIRDSGTDINKNTNKHIYMAVASNPFKTSLAR
jgi:hypothetical protein